MGKGGGGKRGNPPSMCHLYSSVCLPACLPRRPWYCDQTSSLAKILKALLEGARGTGRWEAVQRHPCGQRSRAPLTAAASPRHHLALVCSGLAPSIISMMWDTFIAPLFFWACAASERRHVALSDLDRRIVTLFWCFDLFNTFLGAVLGGAAFQSMGNLLREPGAVLCVLCPLHCCAAVCAAPSQALAHSRLDCCHRPAGYWLQLLGSALPASSTFFLNCGSFCGGCMMAALAGGWKGRGRGGAPRAQT